MSDHPLPAHRTADRSGAVRWIIAALIVIAIFAVALDNREEISVGYVFGDASAPVWVILVRGGRRRHRHRLARQAPTPPPRLTAGGLGGATPTQVTQMGR